MRHLEIPFAEQQRFAKLSLSLANLIGWGVDTNAILDHTSSLLGKSESSFPPTPKKVKQKRRENRALPNNHQPT